MHFCGFELMALMIAVPAIKSMVDSAIELLTK